MNGVNNTTGEPPPAPLSVAQAKLRLREWGVEASIAQEQLLATIREDARALKPWALGAAALTGILSLRGFFHARSASPRKSEPDAEPSPGSHPRLGHALRLAVKLAPIAIDLFLRSNKAKSRH